MLDRTAYHLILLACGLLTVGGLVVWVACDGATADKANQMSAGAFMAGMVFLFFFEVEPEPQR